MRREPTSTISREGVAFFSYAVPFFSSFTGSARAVVPSLHRVNMWVFPMCFRSSHLRFFNAFRQRTRLNELLEA